MAAADVSETIVNQVTLLGLVGKGPKREGKDGRPLISFQLFTLKRPHSGNKEDSHRVIISRATISDAVNKYLKKGNYVYVTGAISYIETDNNDGQNRTRETVIIADDVMISLCYIPSILPEVGET